MEKWMEVALILLLAIALACTMMLSGCTASADNNGNGGQPGSNTQVAPGNGQAAGNNGGAGALNPGSRGGMMRNGNGMPGRGGFGNITDAQRQQMMQAWAAACDGKSLGDACTAQAAFGNAQGEMNGTCSTRNGTLSCTPSGMGGRGWNGTRGGFGQQQ